MFSLKIILAAVAITVAVTIVQWFFIGLLFHKYQAVTPATWRKESYKSYAWSTMLVFIFALLFAWIYSIWKSKNGEMHFADGLEFGIICCLVFIIPAELTSAIYVNYSRNFTLGKCLSSVVEYAVAGGIAFWML
jgi:hypothetical protein